jgi:hypothetical protein
MPQGIDPGSPNVMVVSRKTVRGAFSPRAFLRPSARRSCASWLPRFWPSPRPVRPVQWSRFSSTRLNNAAALEAKGEILLLLNNDIDVIDSGWMREMISHALRPDVGIVGAKLLYPNELVQHASVALGPDGRVTHFVPFCQ